MFGLLPFVIIIVMLNMANHSWLVILKFVLMTLLPVLLSWAWWRAKINQWLAGYTGDTLGAMQQISELAFYLGVLVWIGKGI